MNPTVREIHDTVNGVFVDAHRNADFWCIDRSPRLIGLMERLGVNFKARFKSSGTIFRIEGLQDSPWDLVTVHVRLHMGPFVVRWDTGKDVREGQTVIVSLQARKAHQFEVLPSRDIVLERTKISVCYVKGKDVVTGAPGA